MCAQLSSWLYETAFELCFHYLRGCKTLPFRAVHRRSLEPTDKKAKKEAGSDNWPTVWLRAESGA